MKQKLHYKKIVESLKLISISENEYTVNSYFPDYVDLPFEIIDTYNHAFLLIPQLIEDNFFENRAIAELIRLRFILDQIVMDPKFENQTDEAFFKSKKWKIAINMAREILSILKINPDSEIDKNYI